MKKRIYRAINRVIEWHECEGWEKRESGNGALLEIIVLLKDTHTGTPMVFLRPSKFYRERGEDEGPECGAGWTGFPIIFCPFCGVNLKEQLASQISAEAKAKTGESAAQ